MEQQAVSRSVLQLALERVVPRYRFIVDGFLLSTTKAVPIPVPFNTYPEYARRLNQLKPTKPKPQPSTVPTDSSPRIPFKLHTVHPQPSPQTANPHFPHLNQTSNNSTKTHVTRDYPLQRQLEHGTTNRLLLHLLIRHIILSNHLLHSATRIPPSATFWKLYLPEELSPSARTSIRCKPNY